MACIRETCCYLDVIVNQKASTRKESSYCPCITYDKAKGVATAFLERPEANYASVRGLVTGHAVLVNSCHVFVHQWWDTNLKNTKVSNRVC